MEFTLKEEHILLLSRMYVDFDDSRYEGAPAISIKRPYGNRDVAQDVCEIVGWDYDFDNEELIGKALSLHKETATAMQIVLSTRSFFPGTYTNALWYNNPYGWELKQEAKNSNFFDNLRNLF